MNDYQPENLDIKLFPHQLESIKAMEKLEKEKKINLGPEADCSHILTNFGILGDIPGYGKSLSVVSLILRDRMEWTPSTTHVKSHMCSINESVCLVSNSRKSRVRTTILLASSNLIEQWKEYFSFVKKGQLSIKEISRHDDMNGIEPNIWDVLLVSSTMYNSLLTLLGTEIIFKRFIFDDAASTNLPSMRPIHAGFTWLITATYEGLKCVRNNGWLKELVRPLSYELLLHFVIKNDDEFVKSSFRMPCVTELRYQCHRPVLLSRLDHFIDSESIEMLAAGDIKGVINKIGGGITTTNNLYELVGKKFKDRLIQAETSLNSWKLRQLNSDIQDAYAREIDIWNKRIVEIKNNMSQLEAKYKEALNSECSICYDNMNNPVMVTCCHNLFCGECILKCIMLKPSCPMCRGAIHDRELVYIKKDDVQDEVKNNQKPPEEEKRDLTKPDRVVQIIRDALREDRTRKFLIFSNHDESFHHVRNALNEGNISYAEISGNKSSRDSKIKKYKEGEITVLFLNSSFNGSGMNLQETSDIILYHEMRRDIREQNIGRALRVGRTRPLFVHNLL